MHQGVQVDELAAHNSQFLKTLRISVTMVSLRGPGTSNMRELGHSNSHMRRVLTTAAASPAAGARGAAQAELDQRIAAGRGNGRLLRRQRRGERLRAQHAAQREEAARRRRLVKVRASAHHMLGTALAVWHVSATTSLPSPLGSAFMSVEAKAEEPARGA